MCVRVCARTHARARRACPSPTDFLNKTDVSRCEQQTLLQRHAPAISADGAQQFAFQQVFMLLKRKYTHDPLSLWRASTQRHMERDREKQSVTDKQTGAEREGQASDGVASIVLGSTAAEER